MLVLACFFIAASVILTAIAMRHAPEMTFEQATHPKHECEIIEFPLHLVKREEDQKAA